ncbi:MAG: Mur ligase family protein [Phycisphaerales bacterium JB059]
MGEFDGQRAVVMGLGRFGGGLGAARLLAEQGADVLVTDLEPEARLHESVRALDDLVRTGRGSLRLGGHNVSDFTTCALVVVNPAAPTPWENRFVRAAEAGGARVTSEIALVCERLPARSRVIGVTGSAGKSTCTGMIAHGLRGMGERVALGGNIGGSLLGELAGLDVQTWVALELSSAMLHWLSHEQLAWSPGVAVVTNLEANHLDWHGSAEHYERCKRSILAHQRAGDQAVLGPGLTGASWAVAPGVICHEVGEREDAPGRVLPGRHNGVNAAMAARAIACALGEGRHGDALREVATFGGLPHRLRLILDEGGVVAYDDSKSTTPDATMLAIDAVGSALAQGRAGIHLIAGGYDKGADLSRIAAARGELGGLYTIGATGRKLAELSGDPGCYDETLERAVTRAMGRARAGEAVLLSPGCASWDQFDNFEQRGRRFADLVRECANGRRRSA